MYSCRRCSFVGDVKYFLSKKNNSICKTCENCRALARIFDKKRNNSKDRKSWRKGYEQAENVKLRRRIESKKYYLANKEKILKRNKTYHLEIIDKRREYLSQWRIDNKDKMKQYYHNRKSAFLNVEINDLTFEQIDNLFKNHPYCEYCKSTNNLSLDHIIPVSRSGNNSIDNVTIACKSCNSSKHNKLLEEWR